MNHPSLSSEEATLVSNKYTELYSTLEAYEKNLYNSWASDISDESEANLHKPLIVKGEDGLLQVNFDPRVVALLREVRYMASLQVEPPDVASNIYAKSDTFRKFIFQLDHIGGMYNHIHTGVLDVERPLIAAKIAGIDQEIERALTKLNWKSDNIEEYITSVSASVGGLANILQETKNNILLIQKCMKGWNASPLIERKDGKKMLNLEEKEARLTTIFDTIKKDGKTIHELVETTRNIFQVNDAESEVWVNYLKYVDDLVKEGFRSVIKHSLEYLVENTDSEKAKASDSVPLLEARLELDNEMLLYTPGMDEGM